MLHRYSICRCYLGADLPGHLFQKYKTIRYSTKRENIRGQKVLANSLAQNQRTALSRSNDALVFTGSDRRQGISASRRRTALSDRSNKSGCERGSGG